jgi:hypothetical protein
MNFPARLSLADDGWTRWFLAIPDLPLPNKFALQWTLARFEKATDPIPDAKLRSDKERLAIHYWFEDYERQFDRDQQAPSSGTDYSEAVSVGSLIAAAITSKLFPPVAIGFAVTGTGTFVRKEVLRRRLAKRQKLVLAIKDKLASIRKALR